MRRSGAATVAVALLGLMAIAGLTRYVVPDFHRPEPGGANPDRLPALWRMVEQYRAAQAATTYSPASPGQLDDLMISAESLLRRLPGVLNVDVNVPAEKSAHRVVHLRDWHFVPRDEYAAELRETSGRDLSEADIDRLHEELCLTVEAAQLEQMALLRCLITHHGLHRVFCEGLTAKDLGNFREKVTALRAMEQEQILQLRKQLAEAQDLKNGAAVAQEIEGLLWEHEKRLLELGAAGRLLLSGEIDDVLPLDDAELLEQAKPRPIAGKMSVDAEKLAARHDAIVRAAIADGPLAVIVLGGSHDLAGSVRRRGGQCEYIRVTTKLVSQFMGEGQGPAAAGR